ncbi:hypothetical protein F5Y10DRAFT_263526 [Nemania abortiva]|nr:hypothetical protein F5Y10DRAFT_263526 [Nemania abortiva]
MSSFHSTGDAPTQRVPAWKRLGLKLKPASEAQSNDVTHHSTSATTTTTATSTPSSVPNNRTYLAGSTPNAKRRASAGAPALDHSAKRARQDTRQDHTSHQTPKKAKSVTFTADTAEPQSSTAVRTKQQKQKSTNGTVHATPTKPIKKSAPVNLEPALAYLRTWHTARDNWKFNKNHQTKLLEQVFADADETTIPAADINVFYEYIRGLQGGVRTRLRELANGVKAQDMEQGASAFAASSKTEMAERKQKEYEEVIRMFLSQTRTPEKRRFDEVEYVLRTTDMEMQRRVVKRMRAEMVLDELSETDASETATTMTTTTTTSEESTSTEKGGNNDDQRLKLNDGPQQRTKRKRKLRTAAVEDTSSESESESESDSDTSSSGSSSSSDSDSDEGEDGGAREDDDTSSSSSSSSSESGSDSDDDEEL